MQPIARIVNDFPFNSCKNIELHMNVIVKYIIDHNISYSTGFEEQIRLNKLK